MILRTLRKVIKTDLIIHDMTDSKWLENVDCYSDLFKRYENYHVVSIRTSDCVSKDVYNGPQALVISVSKTKPQRE